MKKVGILLVVATLLVVAHAGPAMAQNNARQVIVFVCAFPDDSTSLAAPTVVPNSFQAFPPVAATVPVAGSCAETISNVTREFPQLRLTAVTYGVVFSRQRTQYTFAAQ
jgi:hypothetical protein